MLYLVECQGFVLILFDARVFELFWKLFAVHFRMDNCLL